MGITDRLKDLTSRAKETAAEHKDQINNAVEKAAVTADQRTGGQYHDQIAKAGAKAEAYLDKLEPAEKGVPQAPATIPPEPPAKPAE